jgi:tripartite-type tricarboxylate transporter receptor subunit TctC
MSMAHIVAGMLLVGLMVTGAGSVYSQDFPNKPVRILTGAPGGVGDITARLISQGITGSLGQPVVIENRSIIAYDAVAKALPDAYTLLLDGGSFFLAPLLQKTPYDVIRDFSPISETSILTFVLVVHPSVAANSVKELVGLAKAKPGVLNLAIFGVGGQSHLAGELFKSMAGVNIVSIPYKGSGLAVIGLLGGEAQLIFATGSSVASQVKSNQLKALAVTSAQPSALFPGLPTVAASGFPGFEAVGITGFFAPAKTPAAHINQLNREVVRVLNQPDVKEKLLNSGVEVATSSPREFAALVKSELAKWGKVIKDAGIKVD